MDNNIIKTENRINSIINRIDAKSKKIKLKGKYSNSSSKFNGVSYSKDKNKWRTYIRFNSSIQHLGYFDTEAEASDIFQTALTRINNAIAQYNKDNKITSDYKGVYWESDKNKWKATIRMNGKTKTLGRFETELEASEAYENALVCINENRIEDIKTNNFSSKYKGVSFEKSSSKWRASIIVKGKAIHIGRFASEIEASEEYQRALICVNKNRIKDIKNPRIRSDYKGVSWESDRNKWRATVRINGKNARLGRFKTELEAHNAIQTALANN